jgi:hypothetical protein
LEDLSLDFSERLKIIKNKIDLLKINDKGYKPIRYTFKETIDIKKIKDFEQKYNVKISEEYIEFITTLGTGVCFGGGIFPPEETLEYIGDLIESESDLQDDFPFNDEEAKAIIEKSIVDGRYLGEEVDFVPGCLLVDIEELGYLTALLVLNGEQKGKLWRRDEYGRMIPFYKITSLGYEQMCFLDFYEDWIEHIFKWLKYNPYVEPENLNDIKYLGFKADNLAEVPAYTFRCKNLEKLYLCNTKLEKIPEEILELNKLEYLGVEYSEISSLPENIGKLSKLKYLHMLKNNISSLPESLFMLNSLEVLDLKCNKITQIPEYIDKLKVLKELKLYENNLTELPNSVGNILTLERLDVSNNDLCDLPKSLFQLNKLKHLEISGNKRLKISSILNIISGLKSLETLTISKSQLDTELKLDNVSVTTVMN